MHRIEGAGAFDFDDDLVIDDQIRSVTTDDLAVKFDLEHDFAIDFETCVAQENCQPVRVDSLQESEAELVVQRVERAMMTRVVST
jgi:hypothetical protein